MKGFMLLRLHHHKWGEVERESMLMAEVFFGFVRGAPGPYTRITFRCEGCGKYKQTLLMGEIRG